ncbi:MAG: alpha/beta hydrolase [Gammaproteobacteria bacterium]|jgi:acetyl esterase/lipase
MNVRNDEVYGRGGGRDLLCDIYTPDSSPNGAGVLMVHGGGWRRGDRAMLVDQAQQLVAKGFTCVACEYRLTPESDWPAQIHDVKAALRWFRANAQSSGVDTDKIAVFGSSAGAHLALLLAATPGKVEFEGDGGNPRVPAHVAAAVAIYPPTIFFVGDDRPSGGTPARALLVNDENNAAAAREASPIEYVHAQFPPTFMLHGTADKVVPPTASLRMYEELAAVGARVELHMYAEQPHGYARRADWLEPTMAEVGLFLDRYVAHPEKFEVAA